MINKRTNHKYNLQVLQNEDDISYYLLGAFITDGCIQENGKNGYLASISSKDRDWLELIRDILCPTGKIMNGNQVGVLCLTNTGLAKWFISKGCIPKKSLTVRMPNVPDQFFYDFLRGCIDGDGSFSKYKVKNKLTVKGYICSSSYNFLLELSHKLQIKHSFHEVKKKQCYINNRLIIPKNKHYRISFGQRSMIKILQSSYYPGHKISMPRKKNNANEILNLLSNSEH